MSREKDTLGSFMRAMRNQSQVTQSKLAERLDSHEWRIVQIENGQREPTMADLVCLARAFDTSPIKIYQAIDEALTRTADV